ncbi:MAG: hypothetical protein JXB03_02730 [Spirochaetales bacterium]|nr:hypothetical protein [Spirochaetales bacterium]
MTQIVCDYSKKVIPNAERNVNYVTVLDKNLSMDASAELELRIRKKMKTFSDYSLKNYREVLKSTLDSMCK